MNVSSLGSTTVTRLSSPYTAQIATPKASTTPVAGDGVTLSGARSAAQAPATETSRGRGGALKSMMVGLALASSMLGLTGCSTVMMSTHTQLPNVQTQVFGSTAKSAYNSLSFLDSVSTKDGGGIYKEDVKPEHRLSPLDAVDRMMDGGTLIYKPAAEGKAHPIRSWAELKGLEDVVRQQVSKPAERAPQVIQQQPQQQ